MSKHTSQHLISRGHENRQQSLLAGNGNYIALSRHQRVPDSTVKVLSLLRQEPDNPRNLPKWALSPRPLDAEVWACFGSIDQWWELMVNEMIDRATAHRVIDLGFEVGDHDAVEEAQEISAERQMMNATDRAHSSNLHSTTTFDAGSGRERVRNFYWDGRLDRDRLRNQQSNSMEQEKCTSHSQQRCSNRWKVINVTVQDRQFDGSLASSKEGAHHRSATPIPTPAPSVASSPSSTNNVVNIVQPMISAEELQDVLDAIRQEQVRGWKVDGAGVRILKDQACLLARFGHPAPGDGNTIALREVENDTKPSRTLDNALEEVNQASSGWDNTRGSLNETTRAKIDSPVLPIYSKEKISRKEFDQITLNGRTSKKMPIKSTRKFNVKKSKWTAEEDRALISAMTNQRYSEWDRDLPPQQWLKDVKLYSLLSTKLAEKGIYRAGSACKNEWNRRLRKQSGFDERPTNGCIRSLVCSEQRPKSKGKRDLAKEGENSVKEDISF